jgi:hypothetical protein
MTLLVPVHRNRGILTSLIKTSQHGFIRGKSRVTNLLEVLNYFGSILDVGGQVDAVYLDMSKAFDKVNHTKHLLHKLRMAGFGGSCTNYGWLDLEVVSCSGFNLT